MKGFRDDFGPLNRDGTGQIGIDATHPGLFTSINRTIKMDDLPRSMDTRVRTARADRGDWRRGKRRQSALQGILHGIATGLRLPTLPGPPVIRHTQCDAWHISEPDRQAHGQRTQCVLGGTTAATATGATAATALPGAGPESESESRFRSIELSVLSKLAAPDGR